MKQGGMKTKDIVELIAALVIFLIAAFFIYHMLGAKSGKSNTATVTQVTPIATDFDSTNLQLLSDPGQTKDFYSPPDLHSGLGNNLPFGQ